MSARDVLIEKIASDLASRSDPEGWTLSRFDIEQATEWVDAALALKGEAAPAPDALERDFVSEATTPDEYRAGNEAAPAHVHGQGEICDRDCPHWQWAAAPSPTAEGRREVLATWLRNAYGHAFVRNDWEADAREILALAAASGDAQPEGERP